MPRRKIQMSLIGDARDRAKAYARRKAGLLKKAQQLAKLCDVDVALVCTGPDGGGAPVVWESDPGAVIDRYRRLPADKRATHTHLGYINGQLGKENGRLDKKRRQGLKELACPGEAELKDMDLEELLASIDAALLATAERRKALGVADDDDGQHLGQQQQVSSDAIVGQGGPPFVGACSEDLDVDDILAWVDELTWDGAELLPPLNDASMVQPPASGVIQYINGGNEVDMDMGSNHQCHQAQVPPPPGNGENGHGQQLLPWHAYQPNTTTSIPDHYGFQCTDNNYVDMDKMPPVQSNASATYGCYDQASWGNPAYMPWQHEHPSMGVGSLMDAVRGREYETSWCLADYLQCPGQQFGAAPEPEPLPLHYLSDMSQDISYYDDLQAGGCSRWRAQFPAQSGSCSGAPQISGGSDQSHSEVGHQYQDPGVQRFWVMEEGLPGSTDVANDSVRGEEGTWANTNSGGLYQPWISVYQ